MKKEENKPGHRKSVEEFATRALLALSLCSALGDAIAQAGDRKTRIDEQPDARAERLLESLSDAEKERLVVSALSLQSAGLVRGLPEKGFPSLRASDSTVGVFRWLTDIPYVSLPSAAGMAATWNPTAIGDAYAMVAREARRSEIAILLAPAVNLVRELRNGRTYEYFGEDPLLAGTAAAAAVRGIQREKVISTLKHFALNDQESGRHSGNVLIGESAMRESDLLAFQLGVEADPGAVMCSYNKVNGVYACQSKQLLTDILKTEWGFKGWVMTDWGAATDAVQSANAGLDQVSAGVTEQGAPNPFFKNVPDFGEPLNVAIAEGKVPASRRDDMVRRILRTAYAKGVVDVPPAAKPLDVAADIAVARRMEEEAIVLLKNDNVLPLSARVRSIAVIGGRADTSVITKITTIPGDRKKPFGEPPPLDGKQPVETPTERPVLWAHSSPLKALRKAAPRVDIRYADGEDLAAAAQLAARSDVAVVFAIQDTNEGEDLRTLRLPERQERLIEAVAKANRNAVVVLENGTAVVMPWEKNVAGIVAAWFPGSGGGEAIADVLTGRVNPSGKLPITFPLSERQQPRPDIPGQTAAASTDNQITTMHGDGEKSVDIDYRIEGSDVGYRWFHRNDEQVMYPFGHGLSYTRFSYSMPQVERRRGRVSVGFTLKNTGDRRGKETAQIYLEKPFRLIGFTKVNLRAGEQRRVTVNVDQRLLSTWDEQSHQWRQLDGVRDVRIGSSSNDLPLRAKIALSPQQ
jgi:beta-glucosidase